MKPKTTLFLIALLTLSLAPVAAASWSESKAYFYDAAGNVTTIGTETYAYDSVDRLISGHLAATERRYEFDAFGNRTKCTDVASGSDCQMGALITANTNRITGAAYDEAGGLQSYGGVAYEYDDVGMLRRSSGSGIQEYVYTADDERIAVIASAHWQWTLRDLSGKVMREMSSTAGATGHTNWQWTRDNVFRNGSLLSSKQDSGGTITTRHYHLDHLGTPRIVSDESGILLSQHDYFPFGLEVPGNPREANATPLQFTGHERDAATNLDYMHARYYDAGWGRFLSVDPTWDSAELDKPQAWNRYSYVRNNPLRYTDPDGRIALVDDAVLGLVAATLAVTVYVSAPNADDPSHTNGQVMTSSLVEGVDWLATGLTSLAEHVKGKRPSTKAKHEKGKGRRGRDRAGEKGDDRRGDPRKKPPGHKGPWPVKPWPRAVPVPVPDLPPAPAPEPQPQPTPKLPEDKDKDKPSATSAAFDGDHRHERNYGSSIRRSFKDCAPQECRPRTGCVAA